MRRHFLNCRIIFGKWRNSKILSWSWSGDLLGCHHWKERFILNCRVFVKYFFSKNSIFRDLSLASTGLLFVVQKRPANKCDCTLRSLAEDGLQWKGKNTLFNEHSVCYFIPKNVHLFCCISLKDFKRKTWLPHMAIDVDNKVRLLCEDFIFLNKCSEVGIYKRNQESKKTRKWNKKKKTRPRKW